MSSCATGRGPKRPRRTSDWAWEPAGAGERRYQLVPTAANGQPAFAMYRRDPRLFTGFGLPAVLPADSTAPPAPGT